MKLRLRQSINGAAGNIPAGTVISVGHALCPNDETALAWMREGIAEAVKSDKSEAAVVAPAEEKAVVSRSGDHHRKPGPKGKK